MLPINPGSVQILLCLALALAGLLMTLVGWRARLLLVLPVIALPVFALWRLPPGGQYTSLAIMVIIGGAASAVIIGAALGMMLRATGLGRRWALRFGLMIAAGLAGVELYRQYVPPACRETLLAVKTAGQTLHIPPEMAPRLERQGKIRRFGSLERKGDFAALCRASRNGTRAVEQDRVWVSPAASATRLDTACSTSAPPAWCRAYRPGPYRHMKRVLVANDSAPAFPPAYWAPGGSPDIVRQGDLTGGSLCLRSRETSCYVWVPFGKGARATVSTDNLNPVFRDMPVDQARQMAAEALASTLRMLQTAPD